MEFHSSSAVLYLGDAEAASSSSGSWKRLVVVGPAIQSDLPTYHVPATADEDISLLTTLEFIQNAMQEGQNILVCDATGSTFAPAVAVGFLMAYEEVSLDNALARIQGVWPRTSLAPAHLQQLTELQEQYDEEVAAEGGDVDMASAGGAFLTMEEMEAGTIEVADDGVDPDDVDDAMDGGGAGAGEESKDGAASAAAAPEVAAAAAAAGVLGAAAAAGPAGGDGGGGGDDSFEPRPAERDDAKASFQGHTDGVFSVALHPTEPLGLSGGGDDRAFLWNTTDGATVHDLGKHGDSVVAVAFSSDGDLAATGGYDGVVKVFDSKTGALVQSMEGPQEVEWLNWHNKGPVVLAGSTDGTCWMWAAKTGDCMQVFAGHEDSVTCGAFTSSGKLVVTGSMDASLRIWSPKTGQCKHTFSPRSGNGAEWHEAAILCLAVHPDPDKPLVLTGSIDGSARLVHAQSKKLLGGLEHCREAEDGSSQSVEAVAFS